MKEIIKWYGSIDPSDPTNLPELIRQRAKLAQLSYDMALKVMNYTREYFNCNTERKISVKQLTVLNLSDGIGKAEAIAESESADKRLKEAEAEGNYRGCREVLHQVNIILQSMIQDISYLRKEYEQTNADNHANS